MATRNKVIFKVIILGDSFVGKTSLMMRYVNRSFSNEYKATIGAGFCTKSILVDDCTVQLQIWDTCGQERFCSLVHAYFKGADACMLVYDVNNKASFNNLGTWRTNLLSHIPKRQHEHFPFVVLGNKVDLEDRQITTFEAKQWCEYENIPYFETSAKDGLNVEEAFETLAKNALAQEAKVAVYDDNDIFRVSEAPEKRNKSISKCRCPVI